MPLWYLVIRIKACIKPIGTMFIPIMDYLTVCLITFDSSLILIGPVLRHKQFSKLVHIFHHKGNNMICRYMLLISRPLIALQYRSPGYLNTHCLFNFRILSSGGKERVEIGKGVGQH